MTKAIYLLGAGGHASVLADILSENNIEISALYAPDTKGIRKSLLSFKLKQIEDDIFEIDPNKCLIINGIVSLPKTNTRKDVFIKFIKKGYHFKSVISKHAVVSKFAELGHGVQVMPGAIIQAGAVIGDNTIINSGAIIEHDCVIGHHNHIAPGATLCGQVKTSDDVFIGSGATVIQNIHIARGAIAAAGSVVYKNLNVGQINLPDKG